MTVACDENGDLKMTGKEDGTTYLTGSVESKADG